VGHIACIGEKRRVLETASHVCDKNIKMDLKEILGQIGAILKAAMNIRVR
jgi:hypothetical protein